MSRWILLLTLVVASTAAGQPAPAPSPAPPTAASAPSAPVTTPAAAPDPTIQAAKTHFEQGVALYNDGNFSAALAEFEESYRLKPETPVLFNIGLTQKALFRYADAVGSLQRYLDQSSSLPPEQRKQAEEILAEMKALLADVSVAVTPSGATITVDGRPAGTAPLMKPLAIAAGTHTIAIAADGYKPQRKDIMVAAGVPLSLKFELSAIPKTGTIRIRASVPGATVSVDGRAAGIAPLQLELGPGGHMVEIAAAGYQLRREELFVAAGQQRDLELTLDREIHEKRWYQKWYVVTPLAVVVAGTAAGIAIGVNARPAPLPGTLAPGAGNIQ